MIAKLKNSPIATTAPEAHALSNADLRNATGGAGGVMGVGHVVKLTKNGFARDAADAAEMTSTFVRRGYGQ